MDREDTNVAATRLVNLNSPPRILSFKSQLTYNKGGTTAPTIYFIRTCTDNDLFRYVCILSKDEGDLRQGRLSLASLSIFLRFRFFHLMNQEERHSLIIPTHGPRKEISSWQMIEMRPTL